MRKHWVLPAAVVLLSACAALQISPQDPSASSSAFRSSSSSQPSLPSSPIELPVEIEEFSSSSAATGTPSTGSGQAGALAERVVTHGILEIGDPDASQILTVFTNYSCDYCEEFMRDMLPRLESDFLMDGKLRIRFVTVPLKKYPNSALEASALLCAAALERGQVMHEALRTTAFRDRKSILALAKKLELPTKEFTACLNAKETKNLLAEQQAFIAEHDVTLIPSFILDEEKRIGLPSYADLRGWVREKLQ